MTGLGVAPRRAEGDRIGDAGEGVAVVVFRRLARLVAARLGGRVLDRGNGVRLPFLRLREVVFDLELAAGRERAAGAGRVHHVVPGLFLLHADLGVVLAVVLLLEGAGVVVKLVFLDVVELHRGGLAAHHQLGRGGLVAGGMVLEVVVGLGPLPAAELVAMFPARDVVGHRAGAGVAGIVHFAFLAVRVGPFLVGQHQRVLAVFVLEEIEDAFFLHQPRDEVEVGFAVLDAVRPAWGAAP